MKLVWSRRRLLERFLMLMRALMGSIALAVVTTSAGAQLSLHWQFCTGNAGIDWDTQIKSCTTLIYS